MLPTFLSFPPPSASPSLLSSPPVSPSPSLPLAPVLCCDCVFYVMLYCFLSSFRLKYVKGLITVYDEGKTTLLTTLYAHLHPKLVCCKKDLPLPGLPKPLFHFPSLH